MYCGNCFRDNALVAALRLQGHDTVMVPLYLPLTLDEASTRGQTPTFYGGLNVFFDQKSSWYRHAPQWLRKVFDAPSVLKFVAGKAAKTRAGDVGELTISMLEGEHGNQARDLDELVSWLKHLPKPDAVFLSNALLVGFARRLRETLGTRVITFLQSEESFLDAMPEPWKSRAWSTLAQRAADVDGWISPSKYFAQRMGERLALPSNKVQVVPNGISLDGYSLLPARGAKRAGDPLTLGFFARMCSEKGLDTVVAAFIELRRRGRVPHLKLKIGGGCGPGDEAFVEEQRQALSSAGVMGDVSFHPNVSREEKVEFYASCDVLSVPAKMSEAFGLYVIESLAAGTPLVQPNAVTYPELLADTGGGVISGPNTAEALAAALEPLLLEPARLRELGDRGRESVFARYSDVVMARHMVTATRKVLEASGAAAESPTTQLAG
ncbi:MAG TPA: glycosyl transferase group 1 [Verrucomicrobiales bacterium]|nr:glycosyl transferase group 1 [Verrucomicrobiales bacterium]